jgi:hypothetical protein
MSRKRVGVVVVASIGVVAAVAHAATVQTLSVTISQSKSSTASKPVPIGLNFTLTTGEDSGQTPPTTSETQVYLAKQLKLHASKFKSCTVDTVIEKSPSGCPAASRVGSGSAKALVGNTGIVEELKVTAFNGPKGKSLVLALDSGSGAPATIHTAFSGALQKAGEAGYGYKLVFPVPAALQEPIPSFFTPLTEFITHIKATTKVTKKVHGRKRKVKVGYIEIAGCPDAGNIPFKTVSTYNTRSSPAAAAEPTKTVEATATCK